jgi:hypothetical protein
MLSGCGKRERARIEIDFSNAAEWKYMLGVDIYGTPLGADSGEYFSGSLRAYLQGLPGEAGVGPLRCGLTDVKLIAPFLPEDERSDVERRLSELRVAVSENGVALSDTAGIPGVFSSGWDILRSPARVIPAVPNADMVVGSSWEREQRFPLDIPQGRADALMYQLYTLDSLYKTPAGVPVAALSWVFTYRVAMTEEAQAAQAAQQEAQQAAEAVKGSQRKYPLAGSGRGSAILDLNRKKLVKSQAAFQVTHSSVSGMDINEVVHFEMVE